MQRLNKSNVFSGHYAGVAKWSNFHMSGKTIRAGFRSQSRRGSRDNLWMYGCSSSNPFPRIYILISFLIRNKDNDVSWRAN
jgi:hypothetical protein